MLGISLLLIQTQEERIISSHVTRCLNLRPNVRTKQVYANSISRYIARSCLNNGYLLAEVAIARKVAYQLTMKNCIKKTNHEKEEEEEEVSSTRSLIRDCCVRVKHATSTRLALL
jgi:hypothetical protein